MGKTLVASIDVSKVDKDLFYNGTKLDLVFFESEEPRFGETHIIRQSRPKDDRKRQMPIIGNLKPLGGGQPKKQEPQAQGSGGW